MTETNNSNRTLTVLLIGEYSNIILVSESILATKSIALDHVNDEIVVNDDENTFPNGFSNYRSVSEDVSSFIHNSTNWKLNEEVAKIILRTKC